MRLFVAVAVPDQLSLLLRALARPATDVLRWTTDAQWHVTLRFLGEVDDPGEVLDALSAVAALLEPDDRPVRAVVGPEATWFPGRHVLQVPVAGLDALAAAVRGATSHVGEPDDKLFNGHLTLARTWGRRPGPASVAGTPLTGSFPVNRVGLYRSFTDPGGSRYTLLGAVAL
ncbi:MAG: RNA 2',3'-cyclic phosphodiesterase [Acidimicrobiales bacterium]